MLKFIKRVILSYRHCRKVPMRWLEDELGPIEHLSRAVESSLYYFTVDSTLDPKSYYGIHVIQALKNKVKEIRGE